MAIRPANDASAGPPPSPEATAEASVSAGLRRATSASIAPSSACLTQPTSSTTSVTSAPSRTENTENTTKPETSARAKTAAGGHPVTRDASHSAGPRGRGRSSRGTQRSSPGPGARGLLERIGDRKMYIGDGIRSFLYSRSTHRAHSAPHKQDARAGQPRDALAPHPRPHARAWGGPVRRRPCCDRQFARLFGNHTSHARAWAGS